MLEMSQIDLKNRRVMIREDLNVPMNEDGITDDTRIVRALPTLNQALSQGAAVLVTSHFGRPKGGVFNQAYSLQPVADVLKKRLDYPVRFAKEWLSGVTVRPGELVLCENVRFFEGEQSNSKELAQKMAALCDVFVMDAFASAHRAHASTAGVAAYAAEACAGPQLVAELEALEKAMAKPERPLLAIVGGAKVSSKMHVLSALLDKVDTIIVGGGMANTLLKAAGYEIGASLYEASWVEPAKEFLKQAKEKQVKVPLPTDVLVGDVIADDAVAIEKPIDSIAAEDKIFDIGPVTIALYLQCIAQAKTIVWNGPVGVFEVEAYRAGTQAVAQAVADSAAFSVAGGGDTIAALNLFNLYDKVSYVSTGGGAFLEFLEGKVLPAVFSLKRASMIMNSIMKKRMSRRTKIIATLGPASDDLAQFRKMVAAGINVVRLNFSHGSHSEHQARIDMVRTVAAEENIVIGILADLQGPKIRIACFKEGSVQLQAGQDFILDAKLGDELGDNKQVGIDYKELPQDVAPDDVLLLDDGRLTLQVLKVVGAKIHTAIKVGGRLSNHKGINRKGGGLTAKALTEKDEQDMQFAVKASVDFIAISFPRDAEDMQRARELMQEFHGEAALIAKIERTEAVDNLEEIIIASDGVMVARGDLAVEIGDAEVPYAQKRIISQARALNVPVITATQMMESMIESTVPTRAEVSDVANAVFDHTDAVMLSAETAVGAHPALVVEAMSRTCLAAERHPGVRDSRYRVECRFERIDESVAMASVYVANHLDIEAIVALTESGRTALWMSRLKTAIPIFALSPWKRTLGKMTLCRGVYPVAFNASEYERGEVNREAIATMLKHYALEQGSRVILTKGDHLGVGGGSNALKILEIGKVL